MKPDRHQKETIDLKKSTEGRLKKKKQTKKTQKKATSEEKTRKIKQ
jgi:hypothetical protein